MTTATNSLHTVNFYRDARTFITRPAQTAEREAAGITDLEVTAAWTLTSTTWRAHGRKYELVTLVKSGHISRIEVYQEYLDTPGLMQFVGYLVDVEMNPEHQDLIDIVHLVLFTHIVCHQNYPGVQEQAA